MAKNNVKPHEIKTVKKMNYGQPARRLADDGNPVTLGEEEGSYVDQSNKQKAKSKKKTTKFWGE